MLWLALFLSGKAETNHLFKKNILAETAILLVAFNAMPCKLTK